MHWEISPSLKDDIVIHQSRMCKRHERKLYFQKIFTRCLRCGGAYFSLGNWIPWWIHFPPEFELFQKLWTWYSPFCMMSITSSMPLLIRVVQKNSRLHIRMRSWEAIETFACFQKIAISLLPKNSVQKWSVLAAKPWFVEKFCGHPRVSKMPIT